MFEDDANTGDDQNQSGGELAIDVAFAFSPNSEDPDIQALLNDEDDEEIEEQSSQTDSTNTPHRDTVDGSDKDLTEEQQYAAILEKYNKDPEKLAQAYLHMQRMAAKKDQEIDTYRRSQQNTPQTPQQTQKPESPKMSERGFQLDEYGVEVIPESFWQGRYLSELRQKFQDEDFLTNYFVNQGYSKDEAETFAVESISDGTNKELMMEFYRQVKKAETDKLEAEREAKRADVSRETEETVRRNSSEQSRRAISEIKDLCGMFGLNYAELPDGKLSVPPLAEAVFNAASQWLTDQVKSGKMSKIEASSPDAVTSAFDVAVAATRRSSGFKDLLEASRKWEAQAGDGDASGTRADARTGALPASTGTRSSAPKRAIESPGDTSRQKAKITQEDILLAKSLGGNPEDYVEFGR